MDIELQRLLDRLKIADNVNIVRDIERLSDNEVVMLADSATPISTLAAFVLERRLVRITARATIVAAIISGVLGGIVGFFAANVGERYILNNQHAEQERREAGESKSTAFKAFQVPFERNAIK